MVDVGEIPRKFVANARAAALQVPVDPRATGFEGPGVTPGDGDVLEIKLDGNPVTLRPSDAAVRTAVGTAYLIGGFELVRALEWKVRKRVDIEGLTLSRLRREVQSLSGEAQRHPRQKDAYDRALTGVLAQIPLAQRRLRTASDIQRLLHAAWARIAAAEERVLREYEPLLINQFVKLAREAGALALREWARYEPYDVTTTDVLPLSTSEANKRSSRDLRLTNEAPGLCRAVRQLHEAWKDYLDAVHSTRTLAGLGARRIQLTTPGADPAQMVADSRANNALKFRAFDECRADVGERFPAALQVYGRIGTLSTSNLTTTDKMIQGWVVEALIEAVESAQDLAYAALMHPVFIADARLRIEPADTGSSEPDLPGYQQELLARGLTIPASHIIANLMADVDNSAKSPWFQLPVRLALYKRGTDGEQQLAPYYAPGRLHHAALSEVNNALQEVRRTQKQTRDQALLVIDAIAVPAGFFTGGSAVAIAGVIHAIVRTNEMYLTVKAYQSRDALAQLALVPMQQAIWEHPSAVTLAGKLLEGGFEIATDLVNGGVAGGILDAIQVSLTIGYGAQAVAAWVAADDPLGDE